MYTCITEHLDHMLIIVNCLYIAVYWVEYFIFIHAFNYWQTNMFNSHKGCSQKLYDCTTL